MKIFSKIVPVFSLVLLCVCFVNATETDTIVVSPAPVPETFGSDEYPSANPGTINTIIVPRRSAERGRGDHGWLNSYHTFTFSEYYDANFMSFGVLRVINEDRVSGGNGFGRHSHRDFEIFSYVMQGRLKHQDSLGNEEILSRGDVQYTSAGKGIEHSEYNADESELVWFLQLWVTPAQRGLTPRYDTRHWSDEEKIGQLRCILSPDAVNNSIIISNDVKVYASLLTPDQTVTFHLAPNRQAYIHLTMDITGFSTQVFESAVEVAGSTTVVLQAGDGLFITLLDSRLEGEIRVTGRSFNNRRAEFLLFDLPLANEWKARKS